MGKECLFCNTAIAGRSDKKFCDDQCRSGYHQSVKNDDHDVFKIINRILKKNREILLKLNPKGKTKVSRSRLLASGFDPNYHTHFYKTYKGNTYLFCYDYGYLQLANGEFLLIKKAAEL